MSMIRLDLTRYLLVTDPANYNEHILLTQRWNNLCLKSVGQQSSFTASVEE